MGLVITNLYYKIIQKIIIIKNIYLIFTKPEIISLLLEKNM